MNTRSLIYLGINGGVSALDKATGQQVWRAELKGSNFVNLWFEDDAVFAHSYGELFCLDAATGALRWQNGLKGLGYNPASFASAQGSPQNQIIAAIEQIRRDEARRSQAAGSSG